jgi:hypothetical protein
MRFSLSCLLLGLVLSACSKSSGGSPETASGSSDQTEGAQLTLPSTVGADTTLNVDIDGSKRAAFAFPAQWDDRSACGYPKAMALGENGENFTYFEVKNPNQSPAAVSLTVEGDHVSALSFYAFASDTPPSSTEKMAACLISDTAHYLGKIIAPALASADGTGLVVGARSSVFVLLGAQQDSGTYAVHARVDALVDNVDGGKITVPAAGGNVRSPVLVSGAQRSTTPLPAQEFDDCSAGYLDNPLGAQPFAYVELENPSDVPATLSVKVEGANPGNLSLLAYRERTPPSTKETIGACTARDYGHYVGGDVMQAPMLSDENGKALVIGAHASAYVLLATGQATGLYTLDVTAH